MLFYAILFVAFWALSLPSLRAKRESAGVVLLLSLVFVLVAGLRYETGYDWPVYHAAFDQTPDLFALLSGAETDGPEASLMEPLFLGLMSLVKTLGGNVQALFFVVALFNTIVLVRFLERAGARVALCMAIYFSWLYLSVQMAVVRQSIAVSFLMLAVLAFDQRRPLKALALMVAGSLFQFSLVMFAPIFALGLWRKAFSITSMIGRNKVRPVWIAILVAGCVLIGGVDTFWVLGEAAKFVSLPFIAEKLEVYMRFGPAEVSMTAIAYFAFNTAILAVLMRTYRPESRLDTMLLATIVMMILAEGFLPNLPVIWNRFQYFGVVAQMVLLSRRLMALPAQRRLVEGAMVLGLSAVVFFRAVLSPSFLPYAPYQSYVEYVMTGDSGTGEDRSYRFTEAFQELAQKGLTVK
ncbi:hypothetical protein R1479_04032 [Ralstonia mannitolilytica]|uniref:EpsG family protein n=1 Tax=Ralstonia mannitolilytica TaxID=105219 RepID=UPI0028F61AAD|nr:EpsG family protein [Ralstonia mannitolilytica]CAJ0896269.1 hypothetical protein R1479_04032 [Ralstonia mannitolilytica]